MKDVRYIFGWRMWRKKILEAPRPFSFTMRGIMTFSVIICIFVPSRNITQTPVFGEKELINK